MKSVGWITLLVMVALTPLAHAQLPPCPEGYWETLKGYCLPDDEWD
ncbi:hypothetical protein IAE37_000153 [Pseudomonas sp. S31]|nr:hypothetical protein [Pseudomonas sp. S31]